MGLGSGLGHLLVDTVTEVGYVLSSECRLIRFVVCTTVGHNDTHTHTHTHIRAVLTRS